jgi:hypothetical protein
LSLIKPSLDARESLSNDSAQVTGNSVTEAGESSAPSLALAWAITIGEAILWGAIAWLFADYWLMLPVRYRAWGIVILVSLAAIGLFRLVRFYRRFPRANTPGLKTRAPERRADGTLRL